MSKVILIMSDALRYDVARSHMGFLGHLVETRQATLYKIIGELPSMSRPMYETIHTGMASSEPPDALTRKKRTPPLLLA